MSITIDKLVCNDIYIYNLYYILTFNINIYLFILV